MTELPRRTLGRTGLEVTVLGYGAMELCGAPASADVSAEEAARVLNAVLDAGINFIDASRDYGRSEELIGQTIAHLRGYVSWQELQQAALHKARRPAGNCGVGHGRGRGRVRGRR